MASRRENRDFRLSLIPWRPGLVTAGQQTSAPEGDLWRAINAGTDLDGLISKRPALTQWGQTIKYPDSAASGSTVSTFVDFLNGLAEFVIADSSGGKITTTANRGSLLTNVSSGTTETYAASYSISALSANAEWSIRFIFRGVNLPAYTPAGTAANTFAIRAQGTAASAKEFAIWSGGLYWKRADNNQYTKVTGSELIGSGSWNAIEIRCNDAGGNTTVYMNDTLLQTLTSSDLKDVTISGTSAFELRWQVEGSGGSGTQYSTHVSTVMYNDTDATPFVPQKFVALTGYQFVTSAGSTIRSLLAGAGSYIYHDRDLEGAWRPLHPKQHSNIYFAPYRTDLVWTDNNGGSSSNLWKWDGQADPELLDDAPPVRFVVEHQQRLLGWGDILNPRRLYYTADRQPNVWFSPSPTNVENEFNTLLNAGYVEIHSKGTEVRAVLGDYYGIALVAAKTGIWKLSGYGTFSYKLDGLKIEVGASNAQSFAQVGNDAWTHGSQGIAALSATEQFGDLQSAMVSIPIQNLWNPTSGSVDSINKTFIDRSRLLYSATHALVLLAVPLAGDQSAQNIYVFNTNTRKFYGPWEVDAEAISVVEVAIPVTDVVMVGGSSGQAGYFNPFSRLDFSTTGYPLTLELTSINGRSQNPAYIALDKQFKTLRLQYIPKGDWDYKVTWWTDTVPYSRSQTRNQMEKSSIKGYVLDKDFRLDLNPDGLLKAGTEVLVDELDLDAQGHDLFLIIEQTGDGEDIGLQGLEVTGKVIGVEVD